LGVRVSDTAGNVGVGLTNSNNYEVDTTFFGWIRQLIQTILATGGDGYRAAVSWGEISPELAATPVLVPYTQDDVPLDRP
jgi:hypothetical protein